MNFSNITTEQKIAKMRDTLVRLENELFDRILEIGIDPDSFDLETYEHPEDVPMSFPRQRILEIKSTIDLLNSKIASLS